MRTSIVCDDSRTFSKTLTASVRIVRSKKKGKLKKTNKFGEIQLLIIVLQYLK